MTSPQFDLLYKQLNPAQKEAVDTIEGPVMVVAGPGTGKTQVLTLRIANILLHEQVNPENILALTFTDSAVLAMRKRLVEIIGTPGYKVEITTFHSFCNDVIKRNPEDFSELMSSDSITEVEQIQLIEEILQNTSLEVLKPFGDPLYHLKNILAGINDLKKEGVTFEMFENAISEQEKDFEKIDDLYHQKGAYQGQMKGKYIDLQKNIQKNKELLLLYTKYQQLLRERHMYDFNDMLLEVIKALQNNKGLLLKLQEMYQFILIDEHQDTNSTQNKLIELLASFYENPNLFVVGDEKQAIFRFQGASLENFLYFKSLYPGAKLINLTDNYRSTQSILDAASSMILKNATAQVLTDSIQLKANAGHPEELIKIAKLSDYHSEYYYVAKDIQTKIKNGVLAKEIAVLARNNRDILPLVTVLEQEGIPFNIEADQNIFADPDIRKLIMLFRAVCNYGSDPELVLLLHADFLEINYLDLYKLLRYSKKQNKSIYEVLSNKKLFKSAPLEEPKKFQNIYKMLQSWKRLCHNDNLETVFVTLVQESGLLNWIMQKPNALEIIDKFTGLFEDIKIHTQRDPNFNLEDYLKYLDLLESHDILIKRSPKTTLKNAVRLMTAHRSKGLEFDWVYIINAFDGHWGNQRKRSTGIKIPWEYLGVKLKLNVELEDNEDERRLFYVALTRARRGVVISFSTQSLEGKEQVASQFVEEIEEKLREFITIEEFENEFLTHKEVLFNQKAEQVADIQNIEFFKELFKERGISATGLNNYLECPWKFFYRNLLQLPDAKTKASVFGSAIHRAINQYIKAAKETTPTVEFLIKSFEDALAKESFEGLDYQELLNKGRKTLTNYYTERMTKWPTNLQTELMIKGINFNEDIKLTGMIDVIQPLGNSQDVLVYDFKTGRTRSRSEMEDYHRQLLFYKVLLDHYLDGKLKMKQGVIEFLDPDPKGRYHQEVYDMVPEEVKMLEDQLLFVAREIMTLAFWNRRCDDPQCQYCKLRDIMLKESSVKNAIHAEKVQLSLV